jgi:O-antigen/teichoic acid export membrane protein
MLLVAIKFIEVFTRAAFVVGTIYTLSLADAGRFGIVVTMVTLFAFAFNGERHLDLQRRHVDSEAAVFDRAVRDALPFWAFNQILLLPVFAVLAFTIGQLTAWQLGLALLIASSEQFSNQTYQMALISPRYRPLSYVVAIKGAAMLATALFVVLWLGEAVTIDHALEIWAFWQVASVPLTTVMWLRLRHAEPTRSDEPVSAIIKRQYAASFTHFQIGIISVLAIQWDRLIVPLFLGLDEVGIYFRHVQIVGLVYQFFNIASYNRTMPRVIRDAQSLSTSAIFRTIRREIVPVFLITVAGFAVLAGLDRLTGGVYSARYHISIVLAAALTAGALVRVLADFIALICHARMREDLVRRSQLGSLLAGGSLLVVLTATMGITGAVIATVVTSTLYLVLIWRAVGSLPPSAEVSA